MSAWGLSSFMGLACTSVFICVLEIAEAIPKVELTCAHCGDQCVEETVVHKDQTFCCHGCKTVYELLVANELDAYYRLENNPGVRVDSSVDAHAFDYLDDPAIKKDIVRFDDGKTTRLDLHLPQIHCSSCIWLLENLSRLNKGVRSCTVNFPKRMAHIVIANEQISLSELVRLLASIGYQPDFSSRSRKNERTSNRLLYKIGIAGFCFGNIMLFAFPEYLGIDASFTRFQNFFGYLSLLLSLPVFFYAGWGYISSAYRSLRAGTVNMDLPIALGMITLLARSGYEILTHAGAGYLDSLSGLVFFLLIGKWFQQKTYEGFSFDRDYNAYFPLGVRRVVNGGTETARLKDIGPGDQLEIRNNELIPSDAVVLEGEARIDYSFVTGESDPVKVARGETVYAGGKQLGGKINVTVIKEVNNSYLTQLWNTEAFQNDKQPLLGQLTNVVGRYFTMGVIAVTLIAGLVWWFVDSTSVWNIVSSILIVACPCALALSVPFTFGNVSRVLGQKGLYLKNTDVVEELSRINEVVFDKTGTLTMAVGRKVSFSGSLSQTEKEAVAAVTEHSAHPLSQSIAKYLGSTDVQVSDFKETPGQGIQGVVDDKLFRLGSANFVGAKNGSNQKHAPEVWLSIDDIVMGYFLIQQRERAGIGKMLNVLGWKYALHLISGDQERNMRFWEQHVPAENIRFKCTPAGKMEYIQSIQERNRRVLMVGDGLNDAGALQRSDVGVAVSDQAHQFSPACDAILDARSFDLLPRFLTFASKSMNVVHTSFAISILYNLGGLYFAVTGQLSPIVAAILMPLSSISVVLFTTVTTRLLARRIKD